MLIDAHSHAVPKGLIDDEGGRLGRFGYRILAAESKHTIALPPSLGYTLAESPIVQPAHWDVEARTVQLRGMNVSDQLISLPLYMHLSDIMGSSASDFAEIVNMSLMELAAERPAVFKVLAYLPIQDEAAALKVIARVESEASIAGFQLGSRVSGGFLDEYLTDRVIDALADGGHFVLVHPNSDPFPEGSLPGKLPYSLGLCSETAACWSRLALSGRLAHNPTLTFVFAHGGGVLPAISGRIAHCEGITLDRLLPHNVMVDSVVHGTATFDLAISLLGHDRVVVGTDYPASTGVRNPAALIASAVGSEQQKDMIRAGNARRLLAGRL